MVQSFSGERLKSFALDMWNGADANADLFQSAAGISFPVLLNAGFLGAANLYNCVHHYTFVIDGDGLVQFRGAGINIPATELVIAQALSRLPDPTDVGDLPTAGFALEANFPNPFNPSTRIPFSLEQDRDGQTVKLDVLNLQGRLVATLVDGPRTAGRHEVTWNGLDFSGRLVPSGTYIARLRAGQSEQSRLLTLLK